MSTKTRLAIILLILFFLSWVMILGLFFTKEEVVEVTNEKIQAFEEIKPTETENETITTNNISNEEVNKQELVSDDKQGNEEAVKPTPTTLIQISSNGINSTNPPANVEVKNTISAPEKEKLTDNYMGFDAIGRIEIPKTGVDYPILKYQSVSGMEVAPCLVYQKGEFNKSGFFYIAGHNYRNGKLFSNNSKLAVGDKITITSLDHNKRTYQVRETFVTTPSDVSYLKQDEDGMTKLILQSCTDNENERLIIIAK